MHDSAILNGRRFFDTYVARLGAVSVVDIGAQDVTGSLRTLCPPEAKYTGVDFIDGKGVDIVFSDPYKLPFDNSAVDVVVSSSCFEHSEMFWVLFLEIMRVLRPDGLFYLNAPSNGRYHRYPVDCWRFYPDSGMALVKWSRLNGYNPALLESYTSNQIRIWNDYVAIYLKDEKQIAKHPDRILRTITEFTNGFLWTSTDSLNHREIPEDQRFLGWRIHKKCIRLMAKLRNGF